MFRCILGACLVLAVVGAKVKVTIDYKHPVLILMLPADDNVHDIQGVTFNYGIKNVLFRQQGFKTSKGWEYHASGVTLDGADGVYADAEIYHTDGRVSRTERSSLDLADSSLKARLPSRRIRGAVVFRDDFNTLDLSTWKHEISMYGGYNGEFQVYTNDPRNAFTRLGHLYIKPTLTTHDYRYDENYLHTGVMDMNALFGTCTNNHANGCHREGKNGLLPPVWSARIKSTPTIKYGVVEVRARIPTGDWIWPAIWMMPKQSTYGTWPRSGEIDIMESRGNAGIHGVGKVQSTLHWGTDSAHNRFQQTTGAKSRDPTWANDFHTWRLEWTDSHLVTYVDNQQIMYVDPGTNFGNFGSFWGNNIWASGGKMAPFDQQFYMILNVAVGGTSGMFSDNYMANKPWKNGSPTAVDDFWKGRNLWMPTWVGDDVAMIIDYVEFRHL